MTTTVENGQAKHNIQIKTVQEKRGTKEAWERHSSDVLLDGEIGLETDTKRFKVGDGSTLWSELEYWDGACEAHTSAEWETSPFNSKVLAAGEIGLETDTKRFKVGDGSTLWPGLEYWDCGEAHELEITIDGGRVE